MVQDPRTAAGARGLRRLNQPQPAAVEADAQGEPKAMLVRGVFRQVSAIHDSWRIDDEWWRDEIARRYFAIEMEGGRHLTVYHDLVTDAWFVQPYDGPKEMEGNRRKRSA
jgi:hypothetical protein